MGIYDRDYIRDDERGFREIRWLGGWSVTRWLIAINVAVFFLDRILASMGYIFVLRDDLGRVWIQEPPLAFFGLFSSLTVVAEWEIWRFVTYQFLHGNLMHLAFNMLGLYFFGEFIESELGQKRYLAFYLLSGVAGAVMYLLLNSLDILIYYPWTPLVGASASIYGIIIAAAWLAPDSMALIYFIFPMRLRTVAMLMIGFAVYKIVVSAQNAGGEAAHLGGAVVGFLLIQNPHWLSWVDRIGSWGKRQDRGPGSWQRKLDKEHALDAEVDRILDKIHREGQESLTQHERQTLIRASREQRQRHG